MRAAEHEPWRRQARLRDKPDHEVAGPIALDAVLGRTASLVVVLLAAHVFSNGIQLELMTRLRAVGGGRDSSLMHDRRGAAAEDGVEDLMHLEVSFPDGRSTTATRWGRGDDALEDHEPLLRVLGGSGSPTEREQTYWLTPLPPPGDLTVVFSWPYRGLAEIRLVIPAADLARALAQRVELWPYQDPEH